MSLVAYGSSDDSEAEAEAQPRGRAGPISSLPARSQQAAGPGLAQLGPRPKKRSEPARIIAPELGSDSDDDEPFQKKTSQGSGPGTGLSALLPQPRNLTLKETNRTLLPYSFTKPAAAPRGSVTTTPSPSAIKAASKNAAKQLARHIMNEKASDGEDEEEEDEEEEEEEGVSFFSLPDREQPPGTRTEAYPSGPAEEESPMPPDPGQPIDALNPADAPLEFNRSAAGSTSEGAYAAASSSPANTAPEFSSQYSDYEAQGTEQSEYYQNYYGNYYPGPDPALTPAPEEELNTFMNDEAFKRLQGKRNRGKEEVSFVEIKGDDQLSGSQQWLMKSLTEEKDIKSFSKKRGEQPTSQQRRKHQITYLIHQAKERELELKNTWSDNRLTKRQTQAKYGF